MPTIERRGGAEREYGARGIVAIATPQANTTVEPEFAVLLDADICMLTVRLHSAVKDARGRLVDYLERLAPALDTLDIAPVDAAGFACTGCAYLVGRATEDERLATLGAARGYPILSSAHAIRLALSALGARRIALLSPYPAWLREECQRYVRTLGVELVDAQGLPGDRSDTRNTYKLRTADIRAGLDALAWQDADAILVSGTGAPSLAAIASRDWPLPVISSNLCLAWALERTLAGAPADRASLDAKVADRGWRERLAARFPHAGTA